MDNFEIIKSFGSLLLLQSAWSYQGKQTVGFLFALLTIKNHINNHKQIVLDSSFNTNPYCTGLMLGLLKHYDTVAQEWFKALQHTFGSLGDEFFWRLIRPILLTASIVVLLYGYLFNKNIYLQGIYPYAPLLFLIIFNIISQNVRLRWLIKAVKSGRAASLSLANYLRRPLSTLYKTLAFLAGLTISVVVLISVTGLVNQIASSGILLLLIAAILALIIFISFLLRTERASSLLLIVGLLIFLVIKLL